MKTLSIILISLASSVLAFGGMNADKLVGQWQWVAPLSDKDSPIGPLVETFTFKADGTYESALSCSGAFSPIRHKGAYTIAGDRISFVGAESTTAVPYAFDGSVLVFPESGHRFEKKK